MPTIYSPEHRSIIGDLGTKGSLRIWPSSPPTIVEIGPSLTQSCKKLAHSGPPLAELPNPGACGTWRTNLARVRLYVSHVWPGDLTQLRRSITADRLSARMRHRAEQFSQHADEHRARVEWSSGGDKPPPATCGWAPPRGGRTDASLRSAKALQGSVVPPLGPNLAESGHTSSRPVGRSRTNAHHWTTSVQIWPMSGQLWPISAASAH